MMSDFNTVIIEEFRANNGKVGGYFAGANMLLFHTLGARSGQPLLPTSNKPGVRFQS